MKTLTHVALFAAFTSLLAAANGCAAAADEEETSSDEPAVQAATASCGQAAYSDALQHYRNAVNGAKDRLAGKQCEDNTHLWGIADESAQAVMTCAAFKDVIKNSPYAKPLRTVLKDSLTLKSLTGELLVLRDSKFANWSNVEAHFPGTVMSTEPQGAVASHQRIEFGANGKASYVVWDGQGNAPAERRSEATYRIEKTGADKAPRKVIIEHDGKTETFDLKVGPNAPNNFSAAPVFRLIGRGPDADAWWNSYNSLTGECDA